MIIIRINITSLTDSLKCNSNYEKKNKNESLEFDALQPFILQKHMIRSSEQTKIKKVLVNIYTYTLTTGMTRKVYKKCINKQNDLSQ